MSARLPFTTPDEETLPARSPYGLVEETLRERLTRAIAAAEWARTEAEKEDAEAELEATYRAIEDYEEEQRELGEELRRDSLLTRKQELTP